jgi:hypothetical protein
MDINDLKNNPEQIKTLISMLSSLLDSNNPTEPEEPPAPSKIKTKRKKINQKNVGSDSSKNLFLDMPEINMHKEDVEIDKKLTKYPPTKRNRKVSLVKTTCRVCGKTEEISSNLLFDTPDRYKCNKCSRAAG